MSEFVSELEKIMPAEELNFDPTPGFGAYKPFLEPAAQHPAKMNTRLLEFLILNFTKEGETVLDPMAGSGSTGVVAALHGRNAVQVEVEERFVKWMEEAKCRVERHPTLMQKGKIVNIHGDARRLSELLTQADIILTSPPYSEGIGHDSGDHASEQFKERLEMQRRYTRQMNSEGNIAKLTHGAISAIITSPPFGDSDLGGGDPEKRKERLIKAGYDPKDFLGGKARNAVLKHYSEVDTIITSPPYLKSAEEGAGVNKQREGDVKIGCSTVGRTVTQPNAVDNVNEYGSIDTIITSDKGFIDCCIMSPPYENQLHDSHEERRNWKCAEIDKAKNLPVDYSPNPENIGNLKSSEEEFEALVKGLMTKSGKPTYLSEMFKVYREMWKVLKPNGLAIIVVKPFQRRGKIVDLPYHTFLLMQRCGFALERLYKLRLKQLSFWRILAYKKNPKIPQIRHEYVLVMRKP
ncbi:MAG: DNA methyltransferase [Nitrososphaerales archaeon]